MTSSDLILDVHLGVALAGLLAAGLHLTLAWMILRRYGRRAEPRLFAFANLLLAGFQLLQLVEFGQASGTIRLGSAETRALFSGQLLANVLVLAIFFHLLATFEQRYRRPRAGLRSWITHHLHRHARLYVPTVYTAVLVAGVLYVADIVQVRDLLHGVRELIGPTSAYLFGASLWTITFVLFPARPGQEHLAIPVAGRALLLTTLGLTVGLLALWHDSRPRVTSELLLPLLHLHSLPVAVFLALVRYEFSFMDRFVKGVLRTVVWAAVVLAAYWLFHRVRFEDPQWGRLVTSVVRVGILLGAIALAPWFGRLAAHFGDRVLFGRRATARGLRRLLARRMASGQGLAALIEGISSDIAHAVRARGAHIAVGDLVDVPSGTRLRVPLTHGGDPLGWLLLSDRRDLLPYFDGERALLKEVSIPLAGAIGALRQRHPAAVGANGEIEVPTESDTPENGSSTSLRARELQQRLAEEARLPQRWTTSVLGAASHVVERDEAAGARILTCLARVAHHIRPGGSRQVRLVEEMEFARDVLALERIRRSNRLHSSLHFPASLNEQAIPRGLMVRLLGRVLAEPVGSASAPIELEVVARPRDGRVEIVARAPEGSGGVFRAHFPRRDLRDRSAATG